MINLIMKAIDLSALAYLDPEEIENKIKDEFYNFHWIENKDTDTQVFICEDDEIKWVVFRGTEFDSINDWMTNLDCSFKNSQWGDVHSGFWNDVGSVMWSVLNQITENRFYKQIIFTGHSQGAACAELMFSDMCYHLPKQNQICIPIEPPRSFSKEAAEKFGKAHGSKIYHVINNNDVVTRVPPRLMGYNHVKNINLNYLDEDGNLHQGMTWWEMFKDRIKGRLYDFGELGTDGIKDHSISEVQRIWRDLIDKC